MKFTGFIYFMTIVGLVYAYEQFCRCQCESNYRIMPLKDEGCNACTKSFCAGLNLEECKDFKEDKILTTCFQRESAKDQLIVYTFILVTVGFLAYSIIGKWLASR